MFFVVIPWAMCRVVVDDPVRSRMGGNGACALVELLRKVNTCDLIDSNCRPSGS